MATRAAEGGGTLTSTAVTHLPKSTRKTDWCVLRLMVFDNQATAASQGLLASLSDILGSPLPWDGAGRCALSFDGGIELLLAMHEDRESLTVSAELVTVADEARCRVALELNYGRLPATLLLALDRASGRLLLFTRQPVASLSGEMLVHLLADFVECLPAVRAHLTAIEGWGSAGISPGCSCPRPPVRRLRRLPGIRRGGSLRSACWSRF